MRTHAKVPRGLKIRFFGESWHGQVQSSYFSEPDTWIQNSQSLSTTPNHNTCLRLTKGANQLSGRTCPRLAKFEPMEISVVIYIHTDISDFSVNGHNIGTLLFCDDKNCFQILLMQQNRFVSCLQMTRFTYKWAKDTGMEKYVMWKKRK